MTTTPPAGVRDQAGPHAHSGRGKGWPSPVPPSPIERDVLIKKLLIAAAIALNLVGCASVPMGDTKADAAAKAFVAPKEATGIDIFRNESMGAAVKMDVEIDVKPGTLVYISQEVKMGLLFTPNKLQVVDETAGKKGVNETRLAETQ